ncbi:uncharacterized protein MELLADRAFT_91294 [Melampsora larici-populina 98AG31]|uniref:Fungal lipase-type domain-containing protein n=1 Tax=Melampsora larici-populina (strain 98AG31 / pathotype 3-4-7) TaxID=747676 RepID=F4RYI3_MELLP|nr:uncharacterized protein MELLADRAFT_91294 [Melampsora larici-populina 98AG31]EGG02476.1 hypothetical protein MELLADRAFT_91294 [Melampsora larici-populina 98AG31]
MTLSFIQVSIALESKPILSRDLKRERLRRHNELQTRQISRYADHPDWFYLNQQEWYELDATQQDHMRFHAYLAMSVYGDYMNTCPKTFLKGFTVLQTFEGGYIAQIPEMVKIVIVFKGTGGYDIDWTPTTLEDLVSNCTDCQVATAIKQQYLHVKSMTNDFTVAKQAVARTGLHFSVTGHGTGGSIAALAAMDLGARDLVHYSHNFGMPRTFNMAAVVRYDNLFQVLSGQSVVARNDFSVHIVPLGPLVHVGSKAHLTGNKTQWLKNCFGDNEDPKCLGDRSSQSDHKYYFTHLGQCGSSEKRGPKV